MAHDGDPGNREMGGKVASDPRPLAQQVQDPAPRRVRKGPPDRTALSLEFCRQTARTTIPTCNATITYIVRSCKGGDAMRSLIRYRTKPESGDENQRLVEQVFEELAGRDPGGVRYATLRLEDGVTFIHIFITDSDDRHNPLSTSPAFAEFQRGLAERCVEQPAAEAATIVGSYRLLLT